LEKKRFGKLDENIFIDDAHSWAQIIIDWLRENSKKKKLDNGERK